MPDPSRRPIEDPFHPEFSLREYLGEAETVFDLPAYDALNQARMAHLASLGLPLAGRRTLEVGAGIGRLTGFFERLGCEIVCSEARAENVEIHRRRRPERHLVVADIERPGAHEGLGRFETVFCYGVLYHLSDPAVAIAEMAGVCDGLLLLETCVNPADNGEVNPVTEPSHVPDQSLVGRGCRPGRDWIFTELRRHFAHVYAPVTQPAHPQFPLEWPAKLADPRDLARAVFIASRDRLKLSTLTSRLPSRYRSA